MKSINLTNQYQKPNLTITIPQDILIQRDAHQQITDNAYENESCGT